MKLWQRAAVLALFVAAGLVFSLVSGGCPIRALTGLPCPGCGMTRALTAALRLDLAAAWYYHPLFPLVPAGAAAFLFWKHPSRAALWAVGISAAVLFLAVYIIRFPNIP